MRDQPERLERKREYASRVMDKMDIIYNSIRNLGLHYKLEENFGCTTITIGRNHHQYSSLYEDLRCGNPSVLPSPQPAALSSQSQAGHASCTRALGEKTASLEAAKKEVAALKDTNGRMIAEHTADKADLREALNNMEAKRDKLKALWQYLNLSQGDTGASTLSLEEIIASHADLQLDVTSLKEINFRVRSEASQAVLEFRKTCSKQEAEAAKLRESLNKSETEKVELTEAWNFLNLSLQQNEAEKVYLKDTNASLQSLMENYKAERKEKEEEHQKNYQDLLEEKDKLMKSKAVTDSKSYLEALSRISASSSVQTTPSGIRYVTDHANPSGGIYLLPSDSDDEQPRVWCSTASTTPSGMSQTMPDPFVSSSLLPSDSDDEQPPVSRANYQSKAAQYKNTRRANKIMKKRIEDLDDVIREMNDEQKETESRITELLKNEDAALKESRLRELEIFKELYKEEESGREFDKKEAKKALKKIQEKLRKTEKLLKEAEETALEATYSSSLRSKFSPHIAAASSAPCLLSLIPANPCTDEQDQTDAMQGTEPLTVTAGLSSFPQSTPEQSMSKGKQRETRGHLQPAIISIDRTIAHREFTQTLEDAEEKSAEEYISSFREAISVTTMDDEQPVALEQFTKFRQHRWDSICKDDYYPNLRETLENAACELATSLKAAQKKLLKDRITAAAKSLNPANPTQEQHFRTIQLLSLTHLIEEDDDALYMVNDPVPLSDPYLRDVLKLICHADYKLGTQDQPPHFIGQDGEGISFSDMVDKLKLRD